MKHTWVDLTTERYEHAFRASLRQTEKRLRRRRKWHLTGLRSLASANAIIEAKGARARRWTTDRRSLGIPT